MKHLILCLVLAHLVAGLALVGWAGVHFRERRLPVTPSPVLASVFWLAMTGLFLYPLLA